MKDFENSFAETPAKMLTLLTKKTAQYAEKVITALFF
jgi:hypothetical protein